jgi:hypothetical protein
VGEKRKLKRGERGPWKEDYSIFKSANIHISVVIDRNLVDYTQFGRNFVKYKIIEGITLNF